MMVLALFTAMLMRMGVLTVMGMITGRVSVLMEEAQSYKIDKKAKERDKKESTRSDFFRF